MIFNVEQQPDGQWCVKSGDIVLLANVTNREAWRYVDIHSGEHVSRAESTADWSVKKSASGE